MNTQGLPTPRLPKPPTLTDREEYVTDQVMQWLDNEQEITRYAWTVFAATGAEGLRAYLFSVIRWARKGTAAWHLAQDLSPNDYQRVCWPIIGRSLTSGEKA